METNSCTVAWEIPGTEQPGGLHDLMTKQQQQQLYYLVKLINGKKIRAELKFYYIFTTTESVLSSYSAFKKPQDKSHLSKKKQFLD